MDISKKMLKGLFWEWVGVSVVTSIFSIGGILSVPVQGGGFGLFYQQIKTLRDKNETKPSTHWYNYLIIIAGLIIILGIVALFGFLALSFRNYQF
jgi:hypothetical protein